MNLLTINSFDCSPAASGGVNRITDILSRQFSQRGIRCFLGFFEPQPGGIEPTPFVDRIQLKREFDVSAFRSFLLENSIDIVQINFLKKKNLSTMPVIYNISHECGAKVIYAFHMCPGFQTVTYGSWEMVRYCLKIRKNVISETKKWLITFIRPFLFYVELILLRKKYRIPYDNCDKLVTLSSSYFSPYLRLAGVKESDKLISIPNALRFSQYATTEDINEKQPIVLVVARLDEDTKRLSLVFKAWKNIENDERFLQWKLQIVGDGRDMGFYQFLVKKWSLRRVEFTGQQNPLEYYRKASLFLMTSSAEGWPLVLLEASQMGVPITAMDTFGSLHDIVSNGKDGLISSSSITDFSSHLKCLLSDSKLLRQMAIETVEKSKQFTIELVADRWYCLFSELMVNPV